MKCRDARKSHLEQASSSVPKVKTQTDVKSLKRSSCDYRHPPRVSWLQVWKQMHFMAIVAYFDMLTVKGNPTRGRQVRVIKDQLLF